MNKTKIIIIAFVISLIFLLCACKGKEINGAESKERVIVSLDDRDFVELIKKDKQYADMAGYKFNEYINHFIMIYYV